MNRPRFWICGFVVILGSTGWAQVTQRVSVSSGGTQGDNGTVGLASISADGRYVAFSSAATNLVPGDTGMMVDVFIRDRVTGTTERVSVDSVGVQGNADSVSPSISADGRYVAFASFASNLVPGDTNGTWDIFVRDRQAGTTEPVSVDSSGALGDDGSGLPSISANGRYMAFHSHAANLVLGDTNGTSDIFVRDRQSGTTERVSVGSGGAEANSESAAPSISADGRHVAFESGASNLVPGDTNGFFDLFVRDRRLGTTERVSLGTGGALPDNLCTEASISADGRYVAFRSLATTLVPSDTNGFSDVFLRDRQNGTTERVSVNSAGTQGNGDSVGGKVSSDGHYVAFATQATNLVPGDTNGRTDVMVRDRQSGTTARVSVDSGGGQADDLSVGGVISADGRYVTIHGFGTNLVPGDTNGFPDDFVHDRLGSAAFTSLCHPGIAGVLACPCSNPPSVLGRGCDTATGTGGAVLSASGGTYLSSDSLVFTARAQTYGTLSILVQGNALVPGGLVYGQGVRCVGGQLERLYARTTPTDTISYPDFAIGDPAVSARSAAGGDLIQAGQSRWYFAYYRDPDVAGGCTSTNTFNATQAGEVVWSP